MNDGRLFALVTVAALAIRLGYFAADPCIRDVDSESYITTGLHLSEGRGFTNASGDPELRRTPGYPLLLSVAYSIGGSLNGLVLFQHLVSALLCGGTALLMRRTTGQLSAAVVAGAYFAIDLPSIYHANRILTETLYSAMIFGTAVLLLPATGTNGKRGGGRLIAAALLAGYAALTRPIGLILFAPVALYLLAARGRKSFSGIVLFCIVFALLPAAWVARNARVANTPVFTTIHSLSVLNYRALGAMAMDASPGVRLPDLAPSQREISARLNEFSMKRYGKPANALSEPEAHPLRLELGRELLAEHPWGAVHASALGLMMFFLGGGGEAVSVLTGCSSEAARLPLLVYTALAFILACAGVVRLLRSHRNLGLLCLLMIAAHAAASAGIESYARFRVPVVPFYAMAVAAGLSAVAGLMSRYLFPHSRRTVPFRNCR